MFWIGLSIACALVGIVIIGALMDVPDDIDKYYTNL